MKTEYFENIDVLGFELKNVQEVLSAHNLGFNIATENEDYLSERYDEDTDSYRAATTDEIIEDAQTAFKAGGKLYATLSAPTDYTLVPNKSTTLQSDFYAGQEVYTIRDNKVVKDKIAYVVLSKNKDGKVYKKYTLMGAQQVYLTESDMFATKEDFFKSIK